MGAAKTVLKEYSRVAAKPIMLALLFYVIVMCLCFFLWSTTTPDPWSLFIDPRMPPEIKSQILERVKDFGSFLNSILQWNFGVQFGPGFGPILPELSWRIRNTLILIGFSTAASILAGTLIALIAFIRKPKKRRPLTFAHSLKGFLFGLTPFIALILIAIFTLHLRLLPRAGLISLPPPETPVEATLDILRHLLLPVLTLTLVNAIRSAMIVWSGSFSLNPKSPWRILLLPVTTIDFTFIVSAAFFAESLFAFPGVGQWLISSLMQNNHPVVIASFVALLAIALGLGLVSAFLDLLQVSTGIRKDLESPYSEHSEIEEQLHKRSQAKNELTDYFKRKSLIVGLILVSSFIVLAVAAPRLTPYLPSSLSYGAPRIAERYAAPAWFTMFPEYSDLNPTVIITPDLNETTVFDQSGPLQVNPDGFNINFTTTGKRSEKASVTLDLGNFSYTYSTPQSFAMHVSYKMYFNRTGVKVYFIIRNYTARPIWEEYFKNSTKAEMLIDKFSPPPIIPSIDGVNQTTRNLKVDSYTSYVVNSLYDPATLTGPPDPAEIIFSEEDVYGIQVKFEFSNVYPFEGAHAELYIREVDLTIWGRVYGILGTDFRGNDVWTELVYGARSITVMSFALAALAVVLGLPFGILAGRFKGWTDNIVIVAAETFLSIPIVPLLLIRKRYIVFSSKWPILFWFLPAVAIIAFRNVYLTSPTNNKSNRSEAFALFRYSLANFFLTAISVLLILTSIDFLGFGDPNQPSWGRMLYHAYQLGGLEAWWTWMVPTGCILLFTFGLFLIGSSLDET